MKKEWKKCLKTIGVFTLSAALLFETALNGVITAMAAEDEVSVDQEQVILDDVETQSVSGSQAEPENIPDIDVNENLYTVKVNNGVSSVYEVKVPVGSEPVLETPVKEDNREMGTGFCWKYFFEKWIYTDAAGNEVTDFTQVPADAVITATAQFRDEKQTFFWTLDWNNGSEVQNCGEYPVGREIVLPPAEAVVREAEEVNGIRTEYAFDRWVITDEEGTEYNELSEVPEGKHVLVKAHYKETKTEIYRLTTMTGNGTDSTHEFPVGTLPSMAGVDLPPLTKQTSINIFGHEITHTFNGWLYTVYSEEYPEGKEITYEDIQNVVKGSVVVAEAQWIDEEQTYWLSVDLDSKSPANPSYVSVLCKVGEDIMPCGGYIPVKDTIVVNNVRTEYTFEKWVITDDEGNSYEKLADVKAGKNVIAKAVYAEKKTNIAITNPQPSTPNPSQPSTTEPEADDTTQNPTMPVRNRRNEEEPLADTLVPPVEDETERDLVQIEDEATPLGDGSDMNKDENDSQNEEVVLTDEEVPLSDMSGHNGCYIHWITTLLSIAYLVYASVRIADQKQKIDELKKNTLTVKK